MTWLPEARASLLLALQSCRSVEAERHIRRALHFMDAGDYQPLKPPLCPHDGKPCHKDCAVSLSLHGTCGRQG